MTPASLSARRRSSVTSMPQGAMTLRRPRAAAWRTRSRMSGRSIGSPPVQMTMSGGKASMTRRHSSVESSAAYGTFAAPARQWRHLSGHCRVTSHARMRGREKGVLPGVSCPSGMGGLYHVDLGLSAPVGGGRGGRQWIMDMAGTFQGRSSREAQGGAAATGRFWYNATCPARSPAEGNEE